MISLLLKYRLKTSLSMFKGGKKVGKTLLLLLAFAAITFSVVSFSFGIYQFVKYDPENGGRVLQNLTVLCFHGMFVFLLIWGLSLAVFSIFFSDDLPLLLSLPIRHRDIFIYKIIETTLLNVRVSLLFLIPILIVFGLSLQASFLYYIIMLIVIFFMGMIPGSWGVIISSLIARQVPKARLRGILTAAGSLIGVAIWAFMSQFSGRFSSESVNFGSPAMKTINLASKPIFNYLPSGWAYKASFNAAHGYWLPCLGFIAILLFISALSTYLAFLMTSRYYAGGISEEVARPLSATAMMNFQPGGSPLMAHIKRDVILLAREPGVILQSVIMLIFLVLYPFIAGKDSLEKLTSLPLSPVGAMFATFYGGQVGSRMIPLERLGFWQNLTMPNGRNLTLSSKVIVGLLIVTLFIGIVAAIQLATGKLNDAHALFLMFAFSWSGFAVGMPLGIFFGNFNWDHPRRMLKGGGGFIYAFAIVVCFLLLYGVAAILARFAPRPISSGLPVLISLGFLAISLILSSLRLANMEWTPEVQ